MDAIILCAGKGTRLRPITDTIPKPLVPILGVSSLERTLQILPDAVDRVILVVGYLGHQIREKISSSHGNREVVYVEQAALDGTGGALRRAESQIRSDRFLVCMGDDLYSKNDLQELTDHEIAILCYRGQASGTLDAIRINAEKAVHGFYRPNAGESVLLNTGAYILHRCWFDTEPVFVPGSTTEWSLPHAIPQIIDSGHSVHAVEATFWMPVGTHEQLAEAEKLLAYQAR